MKVCSLVSAEIEHLLIYVAPAPRIGGIVGLHNRMAGRMIMPGRMFVYRTITASYMATLAAQAKVHP